MVIDSTIMAHPLEAPIREAYAAFGRGDIDGYLQPCAEDFTFHVDVASYVVSEEDACFFAQAFRLVP